MGVKDEEADAEAESQRRRSKRRLQRTLKEQREYLPAFACREDLMMIIRDNQVVVSETKTTQLARFLYKDGYCSYGDARILDVLRPSP